MKNGAPSAENYYINLADKRQPGGITAEIMKRSTPYLFHSAMEEYRPTPLVNLKSLALSLGINNIYIKDESQRFNLNSFKSLGASFAIDQILKNMPAIDTFSTATDGNHGRAVAWTASREGKKSRIFVPAGTAESRIRAIEDEGGVVSVFPGTYEETCRHAFNISRQKGWSIIQDTSTDDYEEIPALIMAGYTTIFVEMEELLNGLPSPAYDIVFLQAGVGSFAASAIWYLLRRYGTQIPKVVIVEPLESDGILESFKNGHPSSPHGTLMTCMAGLNCGIPSLSALEIIRCGADAIISIDDSDAEDAVKRLYFASGNDHKVISGESGAAGLGGLIRTLNDPDLVAVRKHIGLTSDSSVLLINTEGATDPESFRHIINL